MMIFCRLCIHKKREEMCNQYEAHKVYSYYACVKYDFMGYMKSPCREK